MLNASLSYQCENPPQQMLVGQKAWYTRVWVLPGPHFQFTLMYLVPSVKRFFINISRHFVAQTLAQSSCTIPILDKSRTAAERSPDLRGAAVLLADFDFRKLLIVADNGAVVVGGHAVGLESLQDLHHGSGEPYRHAESVGGVERVREVFYVELNAETRIEVAVQDHRDLRVHDGRTGESAFDGIEHSFGVHAGLGGKHEGFRYGRDVECDDYLVREFGDVAAADLADQDDGGAHLLEDRFDCLEYFRVAADHDGQRALNGLGLAAGNRRVDHGDALFLDSRIDFLGGAGGDRTHVYEDGAFLRAFDDAVLPKNSFSYVGRVGEHRDDDITLGSDVSIRNTALGAERDEIVESGELVVHDQRVTSFEQVLRHGATHDSYSDKTDIHFVLLFVECFFGNLHDILPGKSVLNKKLVLTVR